MQNYAMLFSYIFKVRESYIHSKIIKSVEKYLKQELDLKRAICLSFSKNRHNVESFLHEYVTEKKQDNDDDCEISENDERSEDGDDDDDEIN
jgi:hypothetical protein